MKAIKPKWLMYTVRTMLLYDSMSQTDVATSSRKPSKKTPDSACRCFTPRNKTYSRYKPTASVNQR